MKRPVLHDFDSPGPQYFEKWNVLLEAVQTKGITGYGLDPEGSVVDFKKGKRKGIDGKWYPAAGGKS